MVLVIKSKCLRTRDVLIVTAGINTDFEVRLELANAKSTLVVMSMSKLQKSKKSNEI